jgi:hypothetical protein
MSKASEEIFIQGRHTSGQEAHNKTLHLSLNNVPNQILLTPSRTAQVRNRTKKNYWQGHGGGGAPIPCLWDCKIGQPLWKTVRQSSQSLKYKVLKEHSISTPW